MLRLNDRLHIGFETLAAFALFNTERVNRPGYEDISYREILNGYILAPAISFGINSTGFR